MVVPLMRPGNCSALRTPDQGHALAIIWASGYRSAASYASETMFCTAGSGQPVGKRDDTGGTEHQAQAQA